MSDLVGGFACNGCGSSCAYAQGIGYYCTNHKCTYERDQAKAMVEKMHRVADNAGTLEARITELETALAEAEGRVIAARRQALEEAAKACEAERLSEPQDDSDAAYDRAIDHCARAIRALASDPLPDRQGKEGV